MCYASVGTKILLFYCVNVALGYFKACIVHGFNTVIQNFKGIKSWRVKSLLKLLWHC